MRRALSGWGMNFLWPAPLARTFCVTFRAMRQARPITRPNSSEIGGESRQLATKKQFLTGTKLPLVQRRFSGPLTGGYVSQQTPPRDRSRESLVDAFEGQYGLRP